MLGWQVGSHENRLYALWTELVFKHSSPDDPTEVLFHFFSSCATKLYFSGMTSIRSKKVSEPVFLRVVRVTRQMKSNFSCESSCEQESNIFPCAAYNIIDSWEYLQVMSEINVPYCNAMRV